MQFFVLLLLNIVVAHVVYVHICIHVFITYPFIFMHVFTICTSISLYLNIESLQFSLDGWTVGWSVEIFFISQNRSTNQRSGMFSEVQIQIFAKRASFHFQIIPGGPNINIFWWKLARSFLLHKKNKRRNTNLKFDF